MAEKVEMHTGGTDGGRLRRVGALDWVLRVGAVIFALWMISPMFTSSYVEAYVARLQSMAILNHAGLLGMDDQAYPINTELLYVTRVGMVWLMGVAMTLFHSTGLWVLRVITMGSMGLLAASCAVFARRWVGVPAWTVLLCVVLTPGVIEPSFFIADNLVAAALTCLALALVTKNVGFLRWAGIGVIVACATLVRLDSVLVVPAVVAVLWLATREWRRVGSGIAFALLGAAAVFVLSYWGTRVSLLQSFEVGRFFGTLNNNPEIYQTGLRKTEGLIFFGFFGLMALPLVLLGAWANFKRHDRAWSVVMTLLPVLFYAAVIPHANEIRDFCIMGAPFVLLHAATGLRWMVAALQERGGVRRRWAQALLVWFAVVLLAPPYLSMRDGPRALTGRMYTPIFWRQWQGRTLGMVDTIHSLVDRVKPGGATLVISSQFEPERYLHLRLLQEGFHLRAVADGQPTCRSIERFERDGRTVVSVRTENPYGLVPGEESGHRLESVQIVDSLRCLGTEKFAERHFFSIGPSGEAYWPGLAGEEVEIPRQFPLPILHKASYGFLGDVALSAGDVSRLEQAADASLSKERPAANAPQFGGAAFVKLVDHRFWRPRS